MISFNPYFKWICFLILGQSLRELIKGCCFNPYFKWICFLISEESTIKETTTKF